MINLVIFDLDGVLLDSRELHYQSLNEALESIDKKYIINRDEHLAIYDGLPTTKKLQKLNHDKGLPQNLFDTVWRLKQYKTQNLIKTLFKPDEKLISLMKLLKEKGIAIAVASNSIRETVKNSLIALDLIQYVDFYISNEDVKNSKPNVEMYFKAMLMAHTIPSTTLIIEDSHIGRKGATDSGCHLLPVENPTDLTIEKVMNMIENINDNKKNKTIPWISKEMNVLIPMAGAGSRFANAGYTFPKPLIEVHGKPMIQIVVENLNIDANYIFVVQKEHYERYNLQYLLPLITKNKCTIIQTDRMTEGAACTSLLAKEYIDNDKQLFFANSDQFVEWNSNEALYSFTANDIDGGIVTFEAMHPKWSYAKLDENGYVSEVAEKKPISNIATVGFYWWKKGSDYVKYAEQMINNNIRVNNEFYVCPVFNEAIKDNKKIKIKQIEKMWGIGTPEDLNYFLENYKGKL